MGEQIYCPKCRKTMLDTNFYTYKNGDKAEFCKACMTMHINNFEPETFTWLLEKFDVPYIPAEWDVLRDRAYQKDPYKMNGMSVFGKYLSKMKLKQWKNFGWADTEMLQAEAAEKAKLYGRPSDKIMNQIEEMRKSFEAGEISEAQFKTYAETLDQPIPPPPHEERSGNSRNPYPINEAPFEKVDLVDVGAELTQEDKVYLALKWGQLYTAADWVALEQLYNDFMESFAISGAARIDTLKFICKTSLKMNQAIDAGDIDTYQKLSKVYDAQMKAAKFTEAQNKDADTQDFDSIGSIVAFCEKEGGFIPEYTIDAPKDVVDTILADNREYLDTLVSKDSNLFQQIQQFLKKKEIAEEQKRQKQEAKEKGLSDIEVTDSDIIKDNQEIYDELDSQIDLEESGGVE